MRRIGKCVWLMRMLDLSKRTSRADGIGEAQGSQLIRGRALIFWDLRSLPGTKFAKKLDAIDPFVVVEPQDLLEACRHLRDAAPAAPARTEVRRAA
jgi:hypothetical protein